MKRSLAVLVLFVVFCGLTWAAQPARGIPSLTVTEQVGLWLRGAVSVSSDEAGRLNYCDTSNPAAHAAMLKTASPAELCLVVETEKLAARLNAWLDPVRLSFAVEAGRWPGADRKTLTANYRSAAALNAATMPADLVGELAGAACRCGFRLVDGQGAEILPVVMAEGDGGCSTGRCDCAPCLPAGPGKVKTCTCKTAKLDSEGIMESCAEPRLDCNSERIEETLSGGLGFSPLIF